MKPTFKLTVGGRDIEILRQTFPAGESLIRLSQDVESVWPDSKCLLEFNFKNNGDLIDLALITDAIRRQLESRTEICLYMPYLPYARQDRVCNPGESLSIKVVADFINSLNFTHVLCKNIHSHVGEALINNLVVESPYTDLERVLNAISSFPRENVVLVSPDSGAIKKVRDVAAHFQMPHIIQADKVRNTLTGELSGFSVGLIDIVGLIEKDMYNKDFLIVDDICDGGGTFIGLAKELRKYTTGRIYLYVTHGIFSKGGDIFEGVIDGVFTSNLMGQPHELIREIE